MKFKTETEMCEEVTKIIVGGLTDSSLCSFQTIPEVPKGYFSNEHVDMVIIDRATRKFVMIEYKLSGVESLADQLCNSSGANVMGIINSTPRKSYRNMYSYDGSDRSIEIILRALSQSRNIDPLWTPIYKGYGMVYWWGYYNTESSLKGGTGIGEKRPTFHHLFVDAIVNLQNHYDWRLDRLDVFAIFGGVGYGESTMVKHYNTAVKRKPQY